MKKNIRKPKVSGLRKASRNAMPLQMISIRLPEPLIEKLKSMAKKEGLGYQPYTREILIGHIEKQA